MKKAYNILSAGIFCAAVFVGLCLYAPSASADAALTISKKAINITANNLVWSTGVDARPGDIVSFAIVLQATGSQDLHNVFVRDSLPANFTYRDNLLVNSTLNYSGDPISGISIGTIPAGNVAVVSYQAQIAPSANFAFGRTTVSSGAVVSSNETGTQTAYATIYITNSVTQGATDIATGLTNNFFTDSFLLPLMLIITGLWLYFSGYAYKFADYLCQPLHKD